MFMKPKNNMCSSDPTVNIFYPFDPMNNVVSGVCVISSITRHYFSKQTVFFLKCHIFQCKYKWAPLQCIVLQLQQDTTAISKPLPQMKNICVARYHQEEMEWVCMSVQTSVFFNNVSLYYLRPLPSSRFLYYLLTLSPSHTQTLTFYMWSIYHIQHQSVERMKENTGIIN